MSVGADLTIAPIFAGGLAAITAAGTANYAELAALLAILVGIILVTVGLLRAGWLATVLSIPVTTGFLAGISIHIIVGETRPCWVSPRSGGMCLCALFMPSGGSGRPIPTRSRSAPAS